MTGALASEWVKLRSVRSSYSLLGAAAAGVVLAALLTLQGVRLSPVEQVVSSLVELFLAVLGVLTITAEYTSGTIRPTLVAVPRRWPVLAAKAIVVAAVAFGAGEAIAFATFLVSRLIASGTPPLAQELPALLSLGLSVMVVAVVGLGTGTVVRSTAGAIGVVVALLFVLPTLAHLVPAPWGDRLGSVTLPNLAGQLAGSGPGVNVLAAVVGGPLGGAGLLSPAGALIVMAGYVAAALLAGGLTITRRDA